MNEIVFLSPNNKEPFTTSEVIAERTEMNYRSVQRLIEKHLPELNVFGRVRFEITPLETKGGMQNKKIYRLNEQQSTLLVTFMRNNEAVTAFKVELVRQFYAMREELRAVRAAKEIRKPIRKSLTDAIQELPDSPHKQFKYSQYTDLAYKTALGKTAKQIRQERGAGKKANASNFLTSSEIDSVSKNESNIAVLIDLGLEYKEIKDIMMRKR